MYICIYKVIKYKCTIVASPTKRKREATYQLRAFFWWEPHDRDITGMMVTCWQSNIWQLKILRNWRPFWESIYRLISIGMFHYLRVCNPKNGRTDLIVRTGMTIPNDENSFQGATTNQVRYCGCLSCICFFFLLFWGCQNQTSQDSLSRENEYRILKPMLSPV